MSDTQQVNALDQRYIDELVRRIEETNRRLIAEHESHCPAHSRIQRMEVRFVALLAYMAGSGTLGGLAGGIAVRLIGG
jgi:hypothetical protein